MGISTLISRLRAYYTGHGFGVTIRRAGLQVRRALFSNRMVVFYCEVAKQTTAPANIPNFLKVERKRGFAELSSQDLQEMTSFWDATLTHRNIKERFDEGAHHRALLVSTRAG
jgi:hypothetical protein